MTLLLGANSSGKSTFLQALVLASENFRWGTNFSFDLNNPGFTLGPLRDALHRDNEQNKKVSFEFEFGSLEAESDAGFRVSIELDSSAKNILKSSVPIKRMTIEQKNATDSSKLTLANTGKEGSPLVSMKGSYLVEERNDYQARLSWMSLVEGGKEKISALFAPHGQDRFLPDAFRQEPKVLLMESVWLGLLQRFIVGDAERPKTRVEFEQLVKKFTAAKTHARSHFSKVIENENLEILEEWFGLFQVQWETQNGSTLTYLQEDHEESNSDLVLAELFHKVAPNDFACFLLLKAKTTSSWLLAKQPQILLLMGAKQVHTYRPFVMAFERQMRVLIARVHYLGPLRAHLLSEQKNAVSNQLWAPIGVRGEVLAKVLENSAVSAVREYPLPTQDKKVFKSSHTTLLSAVNAWVSWFELGEKIETKDEGIWGSYVEVDGEKFHQKGTGISQILPVITLCLMGRSDSLTLIEQPELHLHPKLQQKLGTFFAEMSKTGRRLIIETHSEYILTRIRRQIATGKIKNEDTSLVFVSSKTTESGHRQSVYEQVQISSSGVVARWPEAFYDFTSGDKLAIFDANQSDD